MTSSLRPRARTEDLIVESTHQELLVYDLLNHRAHALNEAAIAIWSLCNGERTVDEIAAELAVRNELPPAEAEEFVWYGLELLQRVSLFANALEVPTIKTGADRRKMLRGLALVPIVLSIVAPTAADAASCLADGQPCVSAPQCCRGSGCSSPVCAPL